MQQQDNVKFLLKHVGIKWMSCLHCQKNLSDIEQKMLARIIIFIKIMKVQNRFSQNWCKGQLFLFAQQQLLNNCLYLCAMEDWLVIIAESHKNLQQRREIQINIELRFGLKGYLDARPNFANV